jgi:hypothetical protein
VDEFHTRSEAEYEDALSRFPYPLTIVDGADALDEYERLRTNGSPVVLGGPSELALVFERYEIGAEREPSTAIVLERAAEMRFPESLRADIQRQLVVIRQKFPQLQDLTDDIPTRCLGTWPDAVDASGFGLTVAYEPESASGWPRTHLALIPTQDWTEIPAYLRAGGWNSVPESDFLVSALRSWRDRFGAELVGYSHDTMNIRVQRPPSSREEALELAREHYLFCSDALNEVTLKELAALLIESDWWHFWWD